MTNGWGEIIMIKEQETKMLLSLLAYELFGQALPDIHADLDWEKLIAEANDHAVTALLYIGLKRLNDVPKEILNRVRTAAISSAMRSQSMLVIQEEILDALAAQQIDCAVLKGMSVACHYSHPELRVPGDIDLLIGSTNLEAACKALEGIGFVVDQETDLHTEMRRKDVDVELHKKVTRFPDTEKGAWAAVYMEQALHQTCTQEISGHAFPTLQRSFQLISLLTHMSRHMRSSGIGIRQLCDWAVTVHQLREEIDQEDIVVLESCGLLHFASVATRMCEKYLGLPECEWTQDVPEELVDAAMADMLESGNFHAKRENRMYETVLMTPYESNPTSRSSVFQNYFSFIRKRLKESYAWAKSPLWIPVFAAFFPLRWLFRVIIGKRKMVRVSHTLHHAKSRDNMLYELQLFR